MLMEKLECICGYQQAGGFVARLPWVRAQIGSVLVKTSYVVNGKNRCPQGREMHFNGVY